jgi:hypothetical protein
MLKVLSFLFCMGIMTAIYSQQPPNTDIRNALSGIALSFNQYLEFQGDTLVTLINVIPDKQMLNRDSLTKYSRDHYNHITDIAGVKTMHDKYVCIAYKGQQTDKFNLSVWYKNGKIIKGNWGEPVDTLLAPSNEILERLRGLPEGRYVRHQKVNDKWVVKFTTITRQFNVDSLGSASDFDAVLYLVAYLEKNYKLYSKIVVGYLDQYGRNNGRSYTMDIDDLIVASLVRFIKSDPKSASVNFR